MNPIFESEDIQAPITNELCIIFPFDRKTLRYARDTYRKILIRGKCSPELITQVINDIEDNCDNFKLHRLYKRSTKYSLAFALFLIFISMIMGFLGLAYEKYGLQTAKTTDYKTGDNILTIMSIIIASFAVIMLYSVFMVIGYLSTNLNALYIARSDKVLSDYRKKFQEIGMTWKIGPNRLWLELWLDFVNEENPNEQISNFDDISPRNTTSANTNVRELLEKRNREFGLTSSVFDNPINTNSPSRVMDETSKNSPNLLPVNYEHRHSRISSILSLNELPREKGKEGPPPRIMIELSQENLP